MKHYGLESKVIKNLTVESYTYDLFLGATDMRRIFEVEAERDIYQVLGSIDGVDNVEMSSDRISIRSTLHINHNPQFRAMVESIDKAIMDYLTPKILTVSRLIDELSKIPNKDALVYFDGLESFENVTTVAWNRIDQVVHLES